MSRYLRIKRNGLHWVGIYTDGLDRDILEKVNTVNTYHGGTGPTMTLDGFCASHLRTLVEIGKPGQGGSYKDAVDGATWSVEVEVAHW